MSPTFEKPLTPDQKNDGTTQEGVILYKPLTIDQIGALSGEDCLDLIEERYNLPAETLFASYTSTGEIRGTKWDHYYLPIVALMKLEGHRLTAIAAFFSYEFSLQNKADEVVTENDIARLHSRRFSTNLKEKIADNDWIRNRGIDLVDQNEELFKRILRHTPGLNIGDLFADTASMHGAYAVATFSPLQIAQAFALRLENQPFRGILEKFNMVYTDKLQALLSVTIGKTFSKEARAFLPHNSASSPRE